jgi:ABC-type multidrug transport system fused ATPase/permease subunit
MESAVLPPLEGVTNRHLLKWMFAFLAPVKIMVVIAMAWLALQIGAEILSTRQAAEVVNQISFLHSGHIANVGMWKWIVSSDPDAQALVHQLLLLTLLIIAFSILRYLRETSNTKLSMTLVYYLREAIYDKLQRVGFAFHDILSTGQLINRALTDLQNVRTFVQTAVLTTLEIVLVVGGYIILLYTKSRWIALLSLAPLPIWVWYIMRFSKTIQPVTKLNMEAGDANVSILAENIAGVHVIKAFATEQLEIDKYYKNCDTFFERTRQRIVLFANFQPLIRGIASASNLSLYLLAAIFILKGRLGVGIFLILGAAMGSILNRLQQISTINDQYQSAIVSSRRLYEVLMAPSTIMIKPNCPPLPPGLGGVEFAGVTFGYETSKPVLRDVSFKVKGGSMVAIVGPTGAGKTTMVNLLARFYDANSGKILIDGLNIADVSLDSLRTQVAFVFQETYLFSDTVAANIAYGRPGITAGNIEAAARLAQAHDFIMELPRGYDAMLGERGASLSGGQRQRLAIARAILTNPRILVLDDATAAVDPETEEFIRKAMRFVMHERTTFVIAHRVSTVKRADMVIVLENGEVTEVGTHNELMARDGHYRHIAAVQLHGDETVDKEASHMDRMLDSTQVAVDSSQANPPPSDGGIE